jgi:hypothetical protein
MTKDYSYSVARLLTCRNQLDQAAKISIDIDPPFPLDIIVRKPHNLQGGWGFGRNPANSHYC